MSFDCLQIGLPLACLLVNVLSQILFFRNFSRAGLLKSEYWGFLGGLVILLTAESFISQASSLNFSDACGIISTNLIIYSALSYCYFHFLALGETARRIRILRELSEADGGMSLEDILKRYNAKEIFDKRMARLLNNGQIELRQGRYHIASPSMLLITRTVLFFKQLIFSGKSALGA